MLRRPGGRRWTTTFRRTLDFQQQGETEIGAVDLSNCVFDYDPQGVPVCWRVTDVMAYGNGILVNANAGAGAAVDMV